LGRRGKPRLYYKVFVGAQSSVLVVSRIRFLTLLRTPSAFEQFRTES